MKVEVNNNHDRRFGNFFTIVINDVYTFYIRNTDLHLLEGMIESKEELEDDVKEIMSSVRQKVLDLNGGNF